MIPSSKSDRCSEAYVRGTANRAGAGLRSSLSRHGRRSRAAAAISVFFVVLAVLAAQAAFAAPLGPEDPVRGGAGRAGSPARTSGPTQSVIWSGFTPTGWATSAPQTSSIIATSPEGLIPLTDMYRISIDGQSTWSTWSTDHLSVGIPAPTTHNISVSGLVLPDSADLNYIQYQVTEAGGSVSISPAFQIRVDVTAPAAPQHLAASPVGWTNTSGFTITWTNPADVAGIVGAWYKLDAPPTWPTDGTYVATRDSISGITPGQPGTNDGAHPLYLWLQDAFGRADPKTAVSTMLYWDTTPPDPPTWMSGTPGRQWTNVNSFSESWKNPSDLSGIVGAYYKLNSPPETATDGIFVQTENTITGISVPRDGRNTIWVWLVDGAGNVDPAAVQSHSEIFWYDGTPPVSSAVMTPTLPATGWYTDSVSMSLSAADLPLEAAFPPVVDYQLDQSDPEAWAVAPPVITVNTEGTHKLRYRARDKAGNTESTKVFNFGIDKTPPTAILRPDRSPNNADWYTSAVTYTLSVADSISGAPQGFYRVNAGPWQAGPVNVPATFTLKTEGSYIIEYYGQDAAKNRSKIGSLELKIDATPPVTSHTIDGVQGENGWHISDVSVRLQAQDGGSGVATTRYRINEGIWQTGTQIPLSGEGIYNLSYYSTDIAGNVGSIITTQVKLDTAAPAGPDGLNAAPSDWSHTNAFSVRWTSPADFSGVTGAYYKLGDLSGSGRPSGPKDGVAVSQTQRIDSLAVPAEGVYRLYLWLRDAAGNADHNTAPGMDPSTSSPILRYDATAPVTNVEIEGEQGTIGWWRSPVTVTLTATDGASGIAGLHYRLDSGAWQLTNNSSAVLSISAPDKHVVEYYAEDIAGNRGPTQQRTVRLDFTPPGAPSHVTVTPEGWTRFNSFRFDWPTLSDPSGISGAYVKFDIAPTDTTDGVFYPGSTEINDIKVPEEGRHTAYIWLRDGAGNADHNAAIAIHDSVWYDGTPPATVITPTAASGLNGWYLEPVTFEVSAADTASGLLAIYHQIDDGPVQPLTSDELAPDTLNATARFVLSADGRHTVRIWSEDRAGNVEPTREFKVAIDQTPPVAHFTGPKAPTTRTQFDVSWSGADPGEGSGLAGYDVEVRDGYEGSWQNWLRQWSLTSARFTGQRGHSYFFRLYGLDHAGNRQRAPGAWYVLVDPVRNGSFDTGTFVDWTVGGLLYSSVVPTTRPGNVSTLAAKLGSEIYGPSTELPGSVPPGCATISQTISIPGLDQVRHPAIRFWHRVLTYDVMYSANRKTFVDTLDVKFAPEQGEPVLLFRTGNPTSNYGELYDTGWQLANLDLTAYAGRSGVISFANCNGPQNGQPDNLFNTWSYVDDIEIYDRSTVYLPLLTQAAAQSTAVSAEPNPNGLKSSPENSVAVEDTAAPASEDEPLR